VTTARGCAARRQGGREVHVAEGQLGHGLPSRGSVRFRGIDRTHLDASAVFALAWTQVPVVAAVFGALTLLETYGATATPAAFGRRARSRPAATGSSRDSTNRRTKRKLANHDVGRRAANARARQGLSMQPGCGLIDSCRWEWRRSCKSLPTRARDHQAGPRSCLWSSRSTRSRPG